MTSEEHRLFKQLLDQHNVIDGHLVRLLAILENRPPVAVKKDIKKSVRELPMEEAVGKISEDIENVVRGVCRKGRGKKAS